MNELVWFALLGLATWRVTSLFVNEEGPFDIFAKFRHFIGVYYDDYSRMQGKNVVAKAFTCVWCLSIWISLVSAAFNPIGGIAAYLVSAMALSAIAILLDRIISQ